MYCFGCGEKFPLPDNLQQKEIEYERTPVDITDDITRINNLPKICIRGLTLPADSGYYYIVWPGNDYFLARARADVSGRKYLCPSGVRRPILKARVVTGNTTLFIVEGELEALSLAQAPGKFDICSPGAATNFKLERDPKFYLTNYREYVIIVDRDKAGFNAAVSMKTQLLTHSPYVRVVFKDPDNDINDILQAKGIAGVEEWLRGNALMDVRAM